MTESLRAPDERFAGLPGWEHEPRYLENLPGYEGLRMHYAEAGPAEAEHLFLCLHGQPTWSYLYRKMIPVFTAAGHRAIAPDLFGFGRSDKPVEESAYSFDFHRASLLALIERLELENVTLVCQDWGGLLGLTLPMAMPERITRMLVMNTGLGTGDVPLPEAFLEWRQWSNDHPDMAVGRLIARACPHLSPEECAAYDAPFPDAAHKAGVRSFPPMVPDHPEAPGAEISREARDWLRRDWQGKTYMAVGMQDPILGSAAMNALRKVIRGCPPPFELAQAGHFVQEWGETVATKALEYFDRA